MLYLTIKTPRWCKLTKCISKKFNNKKKIFKKVKIVDACELELWTKRTHACDVRAAENRVCKCARQKFVATHSLLICIVNQC